MITGKINLQKLPGATLHTGKDGKKMIVIPTDGNFYIGEKGVYLDIVAFETPNGQYSTHMVCQSISKERREAGEQAPIIGNLSNRDHTNQDYAPAGQQTGPNNETIIQSGVKTDDLPF